MKITFKAEIWKAGNSHVVTIPSAYVENSVVPNGKELVFSVEVPDAQ